MFLEINNDPELDTTTALKTDASCLETQQCTKESL